MRAVAGWRAGRRGIIFPVDARDNRIHPEFRHHGSVRPGRRMSPRTEWAWPSAGPLRGTAGQKMQNADVEWGAFPTEVSGKGCLYPTPAFFVAPSLASRRRILAVRTIRSHDAPAALPSSMQNAAMAMKKKSGVRVLRMSSPATEIMA